MDFETRLKSLEEKLKSLEEKLTETQQAFADAWENTQRFLGHCEANDIKLVSICTATDKVPESKTFPFGVRGNVFAKGRGKDGWPKIWRACEDAGVGVGAGNTDQHQVDASRLVDGVYELKRGKWSRVDA
jgi:hypothetical protein